MSLMSALAAATSGLRTTQDGISLVAQNVANADTAGYTRRRVSAVETGSGSNFAGVRTGAIERVLDVVAQKQLRLESSGAAYTSLTARFAGNLDRLFGAPGSDSSLDAMLNGFTTAAQGLLSDPSSYSARSAVLDAASALASQIATTADGVQSLRTEAEERIGSAVTRANELLAGIAGVNAKITGQGSNAASSTLLDDRDRLIGELSQLMDVQTVQGENNSITLMTTAGLTLFNGTAPVKLVFDSQAPLRAAQLYSSDDSVRGVGTIKVASGNGTPFAIDPHTAFRSGEIAAAFELRDTTLVQAQRQLDELAAGLSLSTSEARVDGTPAALGPSQGFAVDLSTAQAGDVVHLDYVDSLGHAQQALVQIRSGGSPAYPAPASDVPNEPIFTLDLGTTAPPYSASDIRSNPDLQVQLQTAAPPTLQVFQNAAGTSQVTGLALSSIAGTLNGNTPRFPLFVDSGAAGGTYTGVYEGGSQILGFAQRIALNPALVANRSGLVVSSTVPPVTPQGDTARPQLLVDSLTKATRGFSSASGISGYGGPYTSTVVDFARRIVEVQGGNAEQAQRLDQGQQVALSAIQSRFDESASVNIDQEMAQLVALQTAYGANARIMTAARDMLDLLLRM
jgi:flagellar hook-associated protein 1 FlgK